MSQSDLLEKRLLSLEKRLIESEKNCALYKEKYEQASQAYDQLLFAFKQFQRRQFGAKSERFKDSNISQVDMFSSVLAQPMIVEDDEDKDPDPSPPSGKNKKKRSKKSNHFSKSLPRREVIIPAENKNENDSVIRYEITELLNYIPAVYEIIVQKREVIVSTDPTTHLIQLRTAPMPKRLLPQAGVTESFLAHMIVSKIYDRQPLYHLEKQFSQRFNFICPRNKLARWFIDSSKPLQPLVNLLRDEVIDYDIASCDPTHLQVLNEPGRLATEKSYVYTIRGGPPERAVNVFEYQAEEHKAFLSDWFSGFSGYLQVDGQNIFEIFQENISKHSIKLVFCNAHARRKFEPIAKAATKAGLAQEAMQFYQKLYKIERAAKNAQMSPQERHKLRQEKSKPLIEQLEAWLQSRGPTTLPQSPLGKAFQYVLKRQAGLRLFLEDGRLELDNNLTEQKNKDIALARKNFLFSYSVEGAHALCNHMSLIFTAITHGLDPYHYYVHIMQRIPHCATIEDYEQLLPWNVSLPKQESLKSAA